MSTGAETAVERNCRRALALSSVLGDAADFLWLAWQEYGDVASVDDVKAAVEAMLSDRLRAVHQHVRSEHPEMRPGDLAIQYAEMKYAIKQSMAILFPPVEE